MRTGSRTPVAPPSPRPADLRVNSTHQGLTSPRGDLRTTLGPKHVFCLVGEHWGMLCFFSWERRKEERKKPGRGNPWAASQCRVRCGRLFLPLCDGPRHACRRRAWSPARAPAGPESRPRWVSLPAGQRWRRCHRRRVLQPERWRRRGRPEKAQVEQCQKRPDGRGAHSQNGPGAQGSAARRVEG